MEQSLTEQVMESFNVATEDVSTWAYPYCDTESLFRYAANAGKPFTADEPAVVEILKANNVTIIEITQEDIDDYVECNCIDRDTKEALGDYVDTGWHWYVSNNHSAYDIIDDLVKEGIV